MRRHAGTISSSFRKFLMKYVARRALLRVFASLTELDEVCTRTRAAAAFVRCDSSRSSTFRVRVVPMNLERRAGAARPFLARRLGSAGKMYFSSHPAAQVVGSPRYAHGA